MDALLLKDWRPASTLVVPQTRVEKARYPAIDFHQHSQFSPKNDEGRGEAWVRTMDAAGVETALYRRTRPVRNSTATWSCF